MKTLIIESASHGTKEVLLDDEDYDMIAAMPAWQVRKSKSGNFYAHTSIRQHGTRVGVQMHRVLMNAPEAMQVDHINHNGLDNRKENLRICSHIENSRNRRGNKNTTSKYKHVSRMPHSNANAAKKWALVVKKKSYGQYISEVEAALAADEIAKELYGEYAYLNFPNGPSPEELATIKEEHDAYRAYRATFEVEKQSEQAGVSWERQTATWRAHICWKGKHKYLGIFKTEQEAIDVRLAAEKGVLPIMKNRKAEKQSDHLGVIWSNFNQKWLARHRINGKQRTVGSFKTEQEAIAARLRAEQGIFPPARKPAEKQSKQKGVQWVKTTKMWMATFAVNKKKRTLGSFKTEQEAIDVRLAAEQGIFPKTKRTGKQSSQPGVHWSKGGQKWRAMIKINGKQKSLGSFKTEQEAIDARLAAEVALAET